MIPSPKVPEALWHLETLVSAAPLQEVKPRGKAWMGHGGASGAASPRAHPPFLPACPPAAGEAFWVRKTPVVQTPAHSLLLPRAPRAAAERSPCPGTDASSVGVMPVTGLMAPVVSRNSLGIACDAVKINSPCAAAREEADGSTRGAATVPPPAPRPLPGGSSSVTCVPRSQLRDNDALGRAGAADRATGAKRSWEATAAARRAQPPAPAGKRTGHCWAKPIIP